MPAFDWMNGSSDEDDAPVLLDGTHRLLLSVLLQALQDAGSRCAKWRREARGWLMSPGCALLCWVVDVDYRNVARYLGRLETDAPGAARRMWRAHG
jgi:hypothetical protein